MCCNLDCNIFLGMCTWREDGYGCVSFRRVNRASGYQVQDCSAGQLLQYARNQTQTFLTTAVNRSRSSNLNSWTIVAGFLLLLLLVVVVPAFLLLLFCCWFVGTSYKIPSDVNSWTIVGICTSYKILRKLNSWTIVGICLFFFCFFLLLLLLLLLVPVTRSQVTWTLGQLLAFVPATRSRVTWTLEQLLVFVFGFYLCTPPKKTERGGDLTGNCDCTLGSFDLPIFPIYKDA